MKTYILTIILLLSFFSIKAQDCNKNLNLVKSLFEKMTLESALSDPDAITNQFSDLKGSLVKIGKMSLKKDAPKMIFANGKSRKGTAKPGKRRIYVTPLIPRDSITVTISNPQKISEGEILICSHIRTGKTENIATLLISEENTSETFQFPVTGLKGKILSITLKNNSSSKKFEYTIVAQ